MPLMRCWCPRQRPVSCAPSQCLNALCIAQCNVYRVCLCGGGFHLPTKQVGFLCWLGLCGCWKCRAQLFCRGEWFRDASSCIAGRMRVKSKDPGLQAALATHESTSTRHCCAPPNVLSDQALACTHARGPTLAPIKPTAMLFAPQGLFHRPSGPAICLHFCLTFFA